MKDGDPLVQTRLAGGFVDSYLYSHAFHDGADSRSRRTHFAVSQGFAAVLLGPPLQLLPVR